MTDSKADSPLTTTSNLLTYYSHEAADQTQEHLLDHWLRTYPSRWVRLALIEALYRGRYKTISVAELLAAWQRRGQPIYYFNREFEALICHNFPKLWLSTNLVIDPDQPASRAQPLRSVSQEFASTSSDSQGDPDTAPISREPDSLKQSLGHSQSAVLSGAAEDSSKLTPHKISPDTDGLQPTPHGELQWYPTATVTPPVDVSALSETEIAQPFSSHPTDDPENWQRTKWKSSPGQLKLAPIHQFTPEIESSQHYRKLAAIAKAAS